MSKHEIFIVSMLLPSYLAMANIKKYQRMNLSFKRLMDAYMFSAYQHIQNLITVANPVRENMDCLIQILLTAFILEAMQASLCLIMI
jgi:hypothetical protein